MFDEEKPKEEEPKEEAPIEEEPKEEEPVEDYPVEEPKEEYPVEEPIEETPQVCEREAEESHGGLKVLDGTPTAVSKYLRELEEAPQEEEDLEPVKKKPWWQIW